MPIRGADWSFPRTGTHTALSSRLGEDDRYLLQHLDFGSPAFAGTTLPCHLYIVAPSTQGANSAPPKSKPSLLVGWPEAVLSIRSKMRWPHCCTVSSPSRMVPQLTSMSSSIRLNIGELVASLIDGAGLQPNTLPRPVVKHTRLAPPATCPVAATGSYPGVSMNTKPLAVTGPATPPPTPRTGA